MKAVVLAGGHATRLWPVTKDRAKPLLPLGERPIIDYIVEEMEDFDEVLISTNAKFAEDFEEYIELAGYDNVRVVVEEQDSEDEKPGTIGAIINILNQEEIEDDLLIIGGDNYYSFSIQDFVDFSTEKDAPTNVVFDVNDLAKASSFGIVDTEEEEIVAFEEKPEEPPSTLASTACYFYPEEELDLFHRYEEHFRENTDIPEDQFLDEPGRLIEWAHKETDMYAFSFDGEWHDVGTPEGYLDAQASVIDEEIVKGEVENSELNDNVFIMEGSKVKDSELENVIVFHDTEIENCEIRNSIIDNNCELEEADLNDAIIGEHTSM
ncbi:MAG: sugar phosphate nucleotidyltransferase [Candidatus Nanohaloarchaea archaeon]